MRHDSVRLALEVAARHVNARPNISSLESYSASSTKHSLNAYVDFVELVSYGAGARADYEVVDDLDHELGGEGGPRMNCRGRANGCRGE
jgi:hypothetical protein